MYFIDTSQIDPKEEISQIGGKANIEAEYYPICPITQKPMLLLMTLRKDIFDAGFASNNLLEDETFCISVFVSSKISTEYGVGTGMPSMYNINQLSECNKMTNETVKVLLYKDTQIPVTLPDMPIEIPARKIILTKMTSQESAEDMPEYREWFEGTVLQTSKFNPNHPAWLQEPINFDRDIIINYTAKIFNPSFGPRLVLQIEDDLISKNSKIHAGILGVDGMGYLFLPTVVRNWVKKYSAPIEIGNFFTQDT